MRTERQRGSIWTGLVVVLALIGAVCVVLVLVAGSRQTSARRGWKQTLGTPEQLFARFPAREANAAALELERLAAEIGLDIVPRHADDRRRITTRHRPHPPGLEDAANRALKSWVSESIGRVETGVEMPPRAVIDYLDARAESLAAIRSRLVHGDPPRWERRLEALQAAPIPNLLGLIELQKVLVADALLQARRGDESRALDDFDAVWRLAEALVGEPEEIVNLIGMSMVRRVAGALRSFEHVPLEWSTRLGSIEFRHAVMLSLKIEAWMWAQIDPSRVDTNDTIVDQLLKRFGGPYWKASMADLSERLRRRLELLERVDPRCDADLDALGIGFDLRIPRWSAARHYYGPGVFGGVIERVNRLDFDLELTARLIELRHARAENGGRWPLSLPGSPQSRACPGDRWLYEVGDDGSLRFGLERTPEWRELPPSSRGVLPAQVVVR